MSCHASCPPRLLIVPGLHDSGPAHWQTWLERSAGPAQRVRQQRWDEPDLVRWSARIGSTLAHAGPGPWIAVAHSFGVLALVHHLAQSGPGPLAAALLVAPADPARFGIAERLPHDGLPCPATLVASQTDPWMAFAEAQRWAARWRCPLVNLGAAGHINAEAGFGPLPFARQWVLAARRRAIRAARAPAENAYRVAI
jgi:predicted alpha/beta hydrolase family esterase